MKIGIISINIHTKTLNFACPLHTYAFQQFLFQHGIDNTVIDYRPIYDDDYNAKYPLFHYLDRGFGRSFEPEQWLEAETDPEKRDDLDKRFKLRREYVRHWLDLFYAREVRYDKFQEFIDDRYVKTDKCYTHDSLEYDDPGFDCYICVTDVIWKDNPGYGFDRGFFLASDTMKGKGKIAYAASRGPWSAWSNSKEKEFRRYVKDFDYISVREPSLKEHIDSFSEKKAEVVLDPVFLHDKEFYHNLAIPPKEKKYVLLYDVMEKATDSIIHAVRFAQAHGLQLIELSDRLENAYIPEGTWHEVRYDVGIEEWLGYIEHAEYVFTNSFHACCFSIIFEKEFFAGKRNGDKIDTVLDVFGLTWRRLDIDDDVSRDFEKIDYLAVGKILAQKRKESEDYILHAIESVRQKLEQEQKSEPESERKPKQEPEQGQEQKLEQKRKPKQEQKQEQKQERKQKPEQGQKKKKGIRDYVLYGLDSVKKQRGQANHPADDEEMGVIYYHSGAKATELSHCYQETEGKVVKTPKGAWEYKCSVKKDVPITLQKNGFSRKGYIFNGWNARVTLNKERHWYCTDGAFHTADEIASNCQLKKRLFHDCETIEPILPEDGKGTALVMKATWKNEKCIGDSGTDGLEYRIYYHSGIVAPGLSHSYDKTNGSVATTPKGALEYRCTIPIKNGTAVRLRNNWFTVEGYQFCGWNGRIKVDKEVFWYCSDFSFHTAGEIASNPGLQKHLFVNREIISYLPIYSAWGVNILVMEAVWKRSPSSNLNQDVVLSYVKTDYRVYYHSGTAAAEISCGYQETENCKVLKTPKGAWEYQCRELVKAGNSIQLKENQFRRKGYLFCGWNGRITAGKATYWYCTDDRFHTAKEISSNSNLRKYVYGDGEEITGLTVDARWGAVTLVMEAIWNAENLETENTKTETTEMENTKAETTETEITEAENMEEDENSDM